MTDFQKVNSRTVGKITIFFAQISEEYCLLKFIKFSICVLKKKSSRI
jgi:hypothetical protein